MNKVFKVGDKVRVVKRIDSIGWVNDMDKYVGDGEIYTVIESDHAGRVRLDKAVLSNYHWLFPNEALELVNDVDEEYSEEIRVGDSVVVVGTYFTKTAGLDPDLSPFSKDPVEVVDILGKTGIAKLSTGEYYHLKDLEIVDPNFSSEFKVGDTVKVINKVEHERGWANSWVSSMDKYIGSTCVVLEVDPVFGIVLDTGYGLYFPPSSLELVSEVKDCPFKVGDKVVIKNEELLKQWILPSDLSGQIATIHSLQLDDCPSANLEEHGGYFFPLDCLELAPQNTDEKFNVVDTCTEDANSKIREILSKHGITISADKDLWDCVINAGLALKEYYSTIQK